MIISGLWSALEFYLAVVMTFVGVTVGVARADETSASDKLRILYSTRFTFTDDGLPLVTVEIMGNRKDVKLRARGGIDDHRRERKARAARRVDGRRDARPRRREWNRSLADALEGARVRPSLVRDRDRVRHGR